MRLGLSSLEFAGCGRQFAVLDVEKYNYGDKQYPIPLGEWLGWMKGETMKLSARNVLKGTVKKIVDGAVNTEVIIELPGGAEVVSIITRESAQSLGLKVGKEVYAVIKASNVMVAVD